MCLVQGKIFPTPLHYAVYFEDRGVSFEDTTKRVTSHDGYLSASRAPNNPTQLIKYANDT
jgi:NADH:ubiquinone oxidoreductase subunit